MWFVSVVMFAPKVISCGSAASNRSAKAACASATSASDRREVENAPPEFAFDSR
jgi:hypothetical protein